MQRNDWSHLEHHTHSSLHCSQCSAIWLDSNWLRSSPSSSALFSIDHRLQWTSKKKQNIFVFCYFVHWLLAFLSLLPINVKTNLFVYFVVYLADGEMLLISQVIYSITIYLHWMTEGQTQCHITRTNNLPYTQTTLQRLTSQCIPRELSIVPYCWYRVQICLNIATWPTYFQIFRWER